MRNKYFIITEVLFFFITVYLINLFHERKPSNEYFYFKDKINSNLQEKHSITRLTEILIFIIQYLVLAIENGVSSN
jgi:hypothetical protein